MGGGPCRVWLWMICALFKLIKLSRQAKFASVAARASRPSTHPSRLTDKQRDRQSDNPLMLDNYEKLEDIGKGTYFGQGSPAALALDGTRAAIMAPFLTWRAPVI